MTQDNIVTLKSYSIDQDGVVKYDYQVFPKDHGDDDKPLYIGTILGDGTPVNCTCIGYSLKQKCYHMERAREITEIIIE